MRIIYISQEPPYPPYLDGGRLIHSQYAAGLARKLGGNFEYHYFFDPKEGDYFGDVKEMVGEDVRAYPMSLGAMKVRLLKYLLGVPIRNPVSLDLREEDVLIIDGFGLLWFGEAIGHHPVIFFPHDSFSLLYRSMGVSKKNPFLRWFCFGIGLGLVLLERRALRYYDRYVVVSEKDADVLSGHTDREVVILPNGVDCQFFQPLGAEKEDDVPKIVFSGVMDYQPNIDAAVWFCGKVLPKIWTELPSTKFMIVGRNPTQAIMRLSRDKRISATGEVGEIQPYLGQADVFVAPMVSGAGTKNKVLQALAMKKPVVATPLGHGGIEDTPAIIEESTSEGFARRVVALLKNPGLSAELGALGRELVLRKYSWDSSAAKLISLAEQLAGRSSARTSENHPHSF
jgi:glycosyltransferase involved in cell wall biosynthesis